MFAGKSLRLWGSAAALAALCLVFGTAVPAAGAATLPPYLMALEQQMAQLQVNSERFDLQLELSVGEPFGQGIPFVLIFTGSGEAGDSPSQSSAVVSLLGASPEQTRTIGNITYTDRPQAASIDSGRPWVSKSSGETQSLLPGASLEGDVGGAQGTFSKLVEELNGAQGIVESGPVTVDDQRVTEFDAALDPQPYLEMLEARAKKTKTRRPLSTLFEEPETSKGKTPAKPSPPPSLELEVFIAPNGLPVRDRFTFTAANTTIAVRIDTLAINIPVHVIAPPAAQTIGEAQLKKIEQRRARLAFEKALRSCRPLHGKRGALCRRAARLIRRTPSSSGTLL